MIRWILWEAVLKMKIVRLVRNGSPVVQCGFAGNARATCACFLHADSGSDNDSEAEEKEKEEEEEEVEEDAGLPTTPVPMLETVRLDASVFRHAQHEDPTCVCGYACEPRLHRCHAHRSPSLWEPSKQTGNR